MSDTNNKNNTKKEFFDIVKDIRKQPENVGETIDQALANKERPGQKKLDDPTLENKKIKKIPILSKSKYIEKDDEPNNDYAARIGIDKMDSLYRKGSDIEDIEQARQDGITQCENWEKKYKKMDLSEAKKAIGERFAEIKRLFELKSTNKFLDSRLEWLDEHVMEGCSEKQLHKCVGQYIRQVRAKVENEKSGDMTEFERVMQKKEKQLCKIIDARNTLETELKKLKNIIKQPWDDTKTVDAIEKGIKLCIKFQNNYYPGYKVSIEGLTFPKTQNDQKWNETLKKLRSGAKNSVNIRCIQHYIDFVIRTITPLSTYFTNEIIAAPTKYTPTKKTIEDANGWMEKPKDTKLVVDHLPSKCPLYMWPDNWNKLRQFALGDCWLQCAVQGTVIKDLNKLVHLFDTIHYVSTPETKNYDRPFQLVDHTKPISITLNQIMVDLIAKNGFLIIDLRKTNKTFTVTMNPDEITPILIDPNCVPGNTGKYFIPVTATYGNPDSRPRDAYILLPSVIQHGIASVRGKEDSVIPNPNSSWDQDILKSLAELVRRNHTSGDLINVEGDKLNTMSGYVWLGLGNTKSTFNTALFGATMEEWIKKQLQRNKIVNCSFYKKFFGSRFDESKVKKSITIRDNHAYMLHSFNEGYFILVDPNDEYIHVGHTNESGINDLTSFMLDRAIVVKREDFIKNVQFVARA